MNLHLFAAFLCLASTQAFWIWGTKEKCYDIFGTRECFSTKAPYDNAGNKAPESPGHQNVKFYLYTPANPTSGHLLCGTDASCLVSSNFDGSKKTRVITHGYTDSYDTTWIKDLTAEILQNDGSNVIVVDWEDGADNNFLNYLQSAANVRVVGSLLAKLIQQIVATDQNTNLGSFHLIGHSLGAQVSSEAGKRFNGQLGRITGLDPAGPGFERQDAAVRLDSSDALFVDAIHTDGEELAQGGFGTLLEMGDADFYPNEGFDQPGCQEKFDEHLLALFLGGFGGLTDSIACSHMRVLDLFIESVNSECQFTSTTETGATARMGFHADTSASGKYYLETNSNAPYCKS